jgi:ubiquinone/menaquinone biosynthesis C-methylase UbiE
MGRAVTDAIVAEAKIVPHLRVLDVASGTGEPAISIATALGGTGFVTATDISAEPLAVGEKRAEERKLGNIRFRVADVHALPFPDASFERATCRLGVMFFSDLPHALREIHRVLTKDGRVSLLAWGPMQQPYFETTIGTILRMQPEVQVPERAAAMFKFGAKGTLSKALQEAGFQEIDERQCDVPWNWPGTPEDMWSYFRDVTVPFKPLIQSVPENVTAEVLRGLESRYSEGVVHFDARIVLVSAHK